MNDDAPTTQELRVVQRRVEHDEREAAVEDPTETGEHTHLRRADKAGYLAEKLTEQERADDAS